MNLDMTLKRTEAQEQEVGWTPSEEDVAFLDMALDNIAATENDSRYWNIHTFYLR